MPLKAFWGKFLEANIKAFAEFQKKLGEHSHALYGEHGDQGQSELWSQFMSFQGPAMQAMMATYMEQSRKMVNQMQDQLKTQTLNMFSGGLFPASATSIKNEAIVGLSGVLNSAFLEPSST